MAQNRFYSSVAVATTLSANASSADTVLNVNSTTGFPGSLPYTLVLEQDTSNEEVVTVTGVSGLALTVTRGADGTAAVSHSAGAAVIHGVSARDYDEPQKHIAASSAVHGLAGTVVGTTDTQALTNKTISGASNTITNVPKASVVGAPTGAFVGDTDTQTLTNKSLTGAVLDATSTLGGVSGTALAGAWTTYTPTFTNCTSPTGVFAYRIVGKTLFLRGHFTGGTVTANGQVSLTLPASHAGVSGASQIAFGYASVINGGITPWALASGGGAMASALIGGYSAGDSLPNKLGDFTATFEIA